MIRTVFLLTASLFISNTSLVFGAANIQPPTDAERRAAYNNIRSTMDLMGKLCAQERLVSAENKKKCVDAMKAHNEAVEKFHALIGVPPGAAQDLGGMGVFD